MMGPDEVGIGLKVVTITTVFVSFGVAGAMAIEALRAIRAKSRAKYYLLEKSVSDAELREIIGRHLGSKVSPEELESRLRKIEKAISGHLSESDQNFVKQGLHQHSQTGARRYVEDVLSAA
jgi:hypothetical protein